MYGLGQAYALGRGVASDLKEAESWYSMAAGHGKSAALLAIGLLYLGDGLHNQGDCVTARKWMEQAAAKGNLQARYWLDHPSCGPTSPVPETTERIPQLP
jgi:TPR repeat protein